MLALVLFLFSSIPNIWADQPTQSVPRSANDLVKILDIQIPGWKRVGNPTINPIIEKKEQIALQIIVGFTKQGIEALDIDLMDAKKDTLDKVLAKIPRGDAEPIQVKGFEGIKLSSSPSVYEENYKSRLYIKVSDQCLVIINGTEIMDFDVLLKAANLLDLQKLATLTK